MKSSIWLSVAFLCAGPCLNLAAQSQDSNLLRIMFVGNSYTYVNDLPGTLQALAAKRSPPVRVETGIVLVGGQTLRGHWRDSTALAMLHSGNWDYVVLQEQSLLPIQMPDTMLKYGKLFGDAIRAAGAKPVLYLTWNRKNRPTAQDSLTRSYARLARGIGAEVVPVGPAWTNVLKLDRSLELYDPDGSHPSTLGTYTAAAALYRFLFQETPSRDRALVFSTVFDRTGQLERKTQVQIPVRSADLIHRAVERAFKER
jgi:hypothetical protein